PSPWGGAAAAREEDLLNSFFRNPNTVSNPFQPRSVPLTIHAFPSYIGTSARSCYRISTRFQECSVNVYIRSRQRQIFGVAAVRSLRHRQERWIHIANSIPLRGNCLSSPNTPGRPPKSC